MKAVLSKVTGGPDALVVEDIPAPVAGPGQALISVKAVGVNFPDVLMIEDKYQSRPPRPFSPGGELSGVIKAVGEGVTNVKVGDRVLANTGWGGMAEEVALPANRLWHIPDSMPHDEAAAFILWNETTNTFAVDFPAIDDATPTRLVYRPPVCEP
ncbi:MAG: alcohol dehydrogenase catalytic domain-containing protein, partial [Phenylobacterium sp.]|nr:alcohol dehydrogenase catalytic domain-containing protein [Phenylobacterium sp.]